MSRPKQFTVSQVAHFAGKTTGWIRQRCLQFKIGYKIDDKPNGARFFDKDALVKLGNKMKFDFSPLYKDSPEILQPELTVD